MTARELRWVLLAVTAAVRRTMRPSHVSIWLPDTGSTS